MSGIEEWFNQIKEALSKVFIQSVNLSLNLAGAAAEEFLRETKDDLKRWAEQLENNEISLNDIEWLIKAKLEIAKLTILKQAGLSAIALDKLKLDILNILIGSLKQLV